MRHTRSYVIFEWAEILSEEQYLREEKALEDELEPNKLRDNDVIVHHGILEYK